MAVLKVTSLKIHMAHIPITNACAKLITKFEFVFITWYGSDTEM